MNNVKNSIEWADFTWNPITGCKRGCSYCYAQRMWERFNDTPFSDIQFHPERLVEPAKVKKPSCIFVGSMSDPEYWPNEWFKRVIEACKENTKHTFMFLSKDVLYSISSPTHNLPPNVVCGLTVTAYGEVEQYRYMNVSASRRYLSIEPLLGHVLYHWSLELSEQIIVGAMTGPRAVKPKREWIESVLENIPSEKLFLKRSIRRVMAEYGMNIEEVGNA